mmetsp:Transcript_109026/g.292673  ORF Transcript_109026/g.292673 Transcript_109026/m.292673 type:complete len:225 (+) Transcript_109026:548-1222(+)
MTARAMNTAFMMGFLACSQSQPRFQHSNKISYLASLTSTSNVPSSVTTSIVSPSCFAQSRPPWKKIVLMFSAMRRLYSPAGPHVLEKLTIELKLAPPSVISLLHWPSVPFNLTYISPPSMTTPVKGDMPSDLGQSGGPLPTFLAPPLRLLASYWSKISRFMPGSSLLPPSMDCAVAGTIREAPSSSASATAPGPALGSRHRSGIAGAGRPDTAESSAKTGAKMA